MAFLLLWVPPKPAVIEFVAGTGFWDKSLGDSFLFCSTGPSDAVNIIVSIVWYVVIDDMRNISDVDPAGCHVGGHQDLIVVLAKAVQGFLALTLGATRMNPSHPEALEFQRPVKPIGSVFRSSEDQQRSHSLPSQQV